MDGSELSVHFTCNEDDGSYLFQFPCGEQLQVPDSDVERSRALRDMIEGATTSGQSTIPFLSSVELTHFHIWAAAVQPGSAVFQAGPEVMARALEAADYLADDGLVQRLAAAYNAQLFSVDAILVAADADFARALEGMRGGLANTVLAASSLSAGERARRLPERVHFCDEAISAATTAAEAQRATPEGQKMTETLSKDTLREVAVSPDGKLFATCGGHGHVAVWHTASSLLVRNFLGCPAERDYYSQAWSPDGRLLAIGSTDDTVVVWDVTTGAIRVTLEGHVPESHSYSGFDVKSVTWSPDGRKLCSCSDESAVVWDAATGAVLEHMGVDDADFSVVMSAGWGPNGACVVLGPLGMHTIGMWDIATGDRVCKLEGIVGRCTGVVWNPWRDMLAAGCEDETIRVWDAVTGTVRRTLPCLGRGEPVAWSPDGRQLAAAGAERHYCAANALGPDTMQVIDVVSGNSIRSMTVPSAAFSVAWSPCGKLLFAATSRAVYIYNMSGRHV